MSKIGIGVEVKGFKELAQNLKILSNELSEKTIRKALMKAGKFLQGKIRDNAPELTGRLKQGVEVAFEDEFGAGATVNVYTHKKKAFHAHLVEFGHRLVSENGVQFGFVPAKPYFRPAFDENETKLAEIVEEEMRKALEKALRKMNRGVK